MFSTYLRLVSVFLAIVYSYQLVQGIPQSGQDTTLIVLLLEQLANLALWLDLLEYILAILCFAALWCAFLILAEQGLSRLISDNPAGIRSTLVFLVSATFLLSLNAYWFPLSVFSWPVGQPVYGSLALISGLTWLILVIGGGVSTWKRREPAKWLVPIVVLPLVCVLALPKPKVVVRSSHTKPNIIVVGIDALRPDRIGHFGFQPSITPNIDELLSMGTTFTNAYSPMGRTHVAWYSMLSGQLPANHGLRFNLADGVLKNKTLPLLSRLKSTGYHTVWAMDERRFNNFDESYGFDSVIGPELGAADFIIGFIYDNPLTNWIVNTRVGGWFFPFVYTNRAQFKTYNPYMFVNRVVDEVVSIPDKPIFLSVHLTMPHHPFVNHMMDEPQGHAIENSENPTHYRYLSMVQLADKQLGFLIKSLGGAGLLENSVLYLVSDHGEGLITKDDHVSSANPYASLKMGVNGHGTNLLNTSQNKVLLARIDFRNLNPGADNKLRSLVDLAPTVLEDANADSFEMADGERLSAAGDGDRIILLESSFFMEALTANVVNEFQVAADGFKFYRINGNGRLALREDMIPLLLSSKQFAAVSGDYLLMLLPFMDDDAIVLKVSENKWWPISAHGGDLDSVNYRRLLSAACSYRHQNSSVEPLSVCKGVIGRESK